MPRPREGEQRRDFISRCMSSEEARSDFPDQGQRYAFCKSQWDRRNNVYAHADRKVDPTRTLTLRRKFEAEAYRRLLSIRTTIRQAVGRDNVLGLPTTRTNLDGPGDFEFKRDPEKVDSFMEWLQQAENDSILEKSKGQAAQMAGSKSWADTYIMTAYQRGLRDGAARASQSGIEISDNFVDAAFFRPVHADRAGLIFTRTFNELKGITEEMNKQISQILAQGIAEGRHPDTLAKQLADRVDKIGITRARVMSRTEVIASHAEAQLNMYREAGLEGVTAEVEFATAGDDRVCPRCEGLGGKVFSLEQADGMIPVHPNCRCTWIPVIPDVGEAAPEEEENFDRVFPLDKMGFEQDPFDLVDKMMDALEGTRRVFDPEADSELIDAMMQYSDVGNEPINSFLRGINSELDPEHRATMETLDKIMQETSMSRDIFTYRGISEDAFGEISDLKPGDSFVDPGFVSTASMQMTAEEFAEGRMLKVLIPKGAKALPMGEHTTFPEELEVLLPRGSMFRVEEITDEEIIVRVVPNEQQK